MEKVKTPSERSELIKRAASELGFARCGIAAAKEIPRGDFLREWLARGCAGTMGYLHRHVASRVDVRSWLPWARSVIVCALNYKQRPPDRPDDPPRSRVALYAWGEDYHVIVREKLETLTDRLRAALGEPFEAKICVDTSAITERELAAMAGIGWIGKNAMVLNDRLGSFFVLGEIVTDLELATDAPATDHCGTCTRCLEACPTQALVAPYIMDARRCISYLTIEYRGEIEPALAAKMGEWVFGCDICQDVCPYNRESPTTLEPRLAATAEDAWPALDEIAGWDETAYQQHVHGKATQRATSAMWRRNAKIAIA